MPGAESLSQIPEGEGHCKHGNLTQCEHCKAEAAKKTPEPAMADVEEFVKDKVATPDTEAKTIVGTIGESETIVTPPMKMREQATSEQFIKVEVPPEAQRMIDITKQFDESLDPNEYNPDTIQKLLDLHAGINEGGEILLGSAKHGKTEKTNRSIILELESEIEGLYKPSDGEDFFGDVDLRGIKVGDAYLREWLCHHVEMNLELGLVPPTVMRTNGFGIGSVQEWVDDLDEASSIGYSHLSAKSAEMKSKKEAGTLKPEDETTDINLYWEGIEQSANKDQLKSLAVFDFLTENSDRHPGNFGIKENGDVVAFDNGLTFPDDPKKAIWVDIPGQDFLRGGDSDPTFLLDKLAGEDIPDAVLGKLEWFQETPERQEKLQEAMVLSLGTEMGERKWKDFKFRLNHLLETKKIPNAMYLYQ